MPLCIYIYRYARVEEFKIVRQMLNNSETIASKSGLYRNNRSPGAHQLWLATKKLVRTSSRLLLNGLMSVPNNYELVGPICLSNHSNPLFCPCWYLCDLLLLLLVWICVEKVEYFVYRKSLKKVTQKSNRSIYCLNQFFFVCNNS